MLQILELFGGIGSPRIALRNMGIPVKSIDYVEIDEKAVRSYNAMFADQLEYKTQDVCGWNLQPDILIHGSPCQDFSIAGHQGRQKAEDGRINHGKGADKGSGTRSSLMWETINIIRQMGEWKPRIVIWENVKNVRSRYMRHNHDKYLDEMHNLGYANSWQLLDARDYGLPQARQRYFTVSILNGTPFDFSRMQKKPMENIHEYLDNSVDEWYTITAPSILDCIGKRGVVRRMPIIDRFCYTITERPDRAPGCGCLPIGDGKYRYLTERECWRLQGYSDDDFDAAAKVNSRRALYKQAGNSIPVPIFESMFDTILNGGKKIYSSQQTLF